AKVDQLLDLVGELIIAGTAVRHLPATGLDDESFARASAQLDRVVRSLQDVAMSLRMVPVGPTFRRMVRLVRDVSQRVGKAVDLAIEGEETEIDKTVAELITDPLVHLVRNAIDHGLEAPDARSAAGKPRTGQVRLSAAHVGGEVLIRVEDDGRGLDRARIVARAVDRGLVTAAAAARMPDAEVFGFIFEPGFSTAEAVTDVSGRGVGMDVVRRNLELVKGRVDIKSVAGSGAVFTLRIPLTLAIIEGMLVRVGAATFTVPLLRIRESVVAKPEDVTVLSTGQEVVRIRGELLPVLRMHRLYEIEPDHTAIERGILVVVEDGGQPLCLFVDELIGQRQTVIKAVSGYLGVIRGVAGCTVLGDGRISLILDVGALVRVTGSGA
ncbi:MAG: chemotaxis protein CheA, partial [Myxococcota bacterium]